MTEFEKQMRVGAIHAKLDIFKRRLQFSLDGIKAMRELAPKAYLSLSFGKQSSIVAHMLYQIEPTMPMYFLASGESFILHNYAEVIEEFTAKWPVKLHIVNRDHVYNGRKLSWRESRNAGHKDLQTMCDRNDWDGWYWGLSRDESNSRFFSLAKKWEGQPHPAIFRYKDGKYRCCPIMNWGIDDIAAYTGMFGIPLLEQYKRIGLQTRTTARVTRRTAELGGIVSIKQTNIEAFNILCNRFPELRSYT